MAVAAPVAGLSTETLDGVRALVSQSLKSGGVDISLDEVARGVGASLDALVHRFGTVECLVDEVVAGVVWRARPYIVQGDATIGLDVVIGGLVTARIAIDERLDDVWNLIGQGEASAQEFEALRSVLAADIEFRFEPFLRRLSATQQREPFRSIDAAVSLAAVRGLRRHRNESVAETRRILVSQIHELVDNI